MKAPKALTLRQLLAMAAAKAGIRISQLYGLLRDGHPIPPEILLKMRGALEEMGWGRERFYLD